LAFLFYPEALNQHPMTLLHEAKLLMIWFPIGCVAYIWTFSVLMVYTAFAKQLPARVMHNASMAVGLAIIAILPLYSFRLSCTSGQTSRQFSDSAFRFWLSCLRLQLPFIL
jgi:hypothetical protein